MTADGSATGARDGAAHGARAVPQGGARGAPIGTLLGALLVFAVAVAARLPGHAFGLPHRGEPDPYVLQQTEGLATRGLLDRRDAAWKYPLLVATLAAAWPDASPRAAAAPTLDAHLAAAGRTQRRVRLVALLLSALLAPATYLLARAFVPERWALAAGLLAATSLLHLCFSLQARPHGPASGFTALALAALVALAQRTTWPRAVAAGLAVGAALAALQTGALLLAPLALVALLALRERGVRALGPLALVGVVVVAAGLWAYVPGERLRAARAASGAQVSVAPPEGTFEFFGHHVPWSTFDGTGFRELGRAFWQYDPLLSVLACLGSACALWGLRPRRRATGAEPPAAPAAGSRRAALVLAAYFVPATAIYGAFARTAPRLVLVYVALLATLAAVALARAGRARRGALAAGLVLVLTALPAARLAWLRARPDTTQAAARAVEAACAAGAERVLCLNLASLPLLQAPGLAHRDGGWSRSRWEDYQAALAARDGGATARRLGLPLAYPSAAELRALYAGEDQAAAARALLAAYDPDLVVLGTALPATDPPRFLVDALAAYRAALAAPRYRLDAVLEACGEVDVSFQTTLAVVATARRFGPRVEIWRRADG